jgi:hypothetical protein
MKEKAVVDISAMNINRRESLSLEMGKICFTVITSVLT